MLLQKTHQSYITMKKSAISHGLSSSYVCKQNREDAKKEMGKKVREEEVKQNGKAEKEEEREQKEVVGDSKNFESDVEGDNTLGDSDESRKQAREEEVKLNGKTEKEEEREQKEVVRDNKKEESDVEGDYTLGDSNEPRTQAREEEVKQNGKAEKEEEKEQNEYEVVRDNNMAESDIEGYDTPGDKEWPKKQAWKKEEKRNRKLSKRPPKEEKARNRKPSKRARKKEKKRNKTSSKRPRDEGEKCREKNETKEERKQNESIEDGNVDESDAEIDDDTLAYIDNGMEDELSGDMKGNTKEGCLQYQTYKWAQPEEDGEPELIQVLRQFYKHLQRPAGGNKGDETRQSYAQMILRIALAHPEQGLHAFFSEDWLWDEWVIKELNSKPTTGSTQRRLKAKTIKVYLLVCENFIKFLCNKNVVKLTNQNRESLQQLLSELSDYRKALRRHVKAETEDKFYKDLEEIPSVKDLKEMLRGVYARETIAMVVCQKYDVPLSNNDETRIRDYLCSRVIIENISRSGILGELSVESILGATYRRENDNYTTKCLMHKTLVNYGMTFPTFTPELCDLLIIYIEKIRPRLIDDAHLPNTDRPLFVSNNGRGMTSSELGRRIGEFHKKCGGKKRVTPTTVRKTSSTEASNATPKEQERHASLLEHSQRVEQECYV